ncbi:MAG: WD40 repeat domain-containing protein, partial [Actinomycetota bacterium]
NQELALLIAAEAFDQSVEGLGEPLPKATSALAQAIQDWRLIGRFPAGEERIAEGSPDGSLVVTSVGELPSPVVNVFDAKGERVSILEGPGDSGILARQAVFHPDGDKIAVSYTTIGEDAVYQPAPEGASDVIVFDAVSGSVLSRVDVVGDDSALWLSFGPSGETIAVSSRQDVRVVDWRQGTEIVSFAQSSNVGRAIFLDEETLLVPVDGSGLVRYSIVDGSPIEQIDDPELTSLSTAADSTGTRFAYLAGDRIRVVDIAAGEVVFDQEAPGVVDLALNPDGTRLAYSGFDPNIYVVPVDGEGVGLELTGSFDNVAALSFIGEDRLLSHGDDALMWDVSQAATKTLDGIAVSGPLFNYAVSPDQNWMSYTLSTNSMSTAAHPADGFHLLDLETAEEILVQKGELVNTFAGVGMVSPDFTMVGSLSSDGRSTVRRLPSWDVVREFEECRNPLAFTPDNSGTLLSGWVCDADAEPPDGAATESEVIDLDSGESILTLPKRSYFSGEFNPGGVFAGGRYLVASDRLSIEVWDLRTGELVGRLERSELIPDQSNLNAVGFLMTVNFDPSGRYVVGGTTGGTVWALDMEQLIAGVDMRDALVFREQAHTGAAPVPDLNADGLVATAGFDTMVRLWDLESGDLLMEFETEMTMPVLRFTSDGTQLLYPHGPSIRRSPVDPYELRALAGDLLTRDFLPDECARYARPERCARLDAAGVG